MSSHCLCCHRKENYPEGLNHFIQHDLIKINGRHHFFICEKCISFIQAGKFNDINFKNTQNFIALQYDCIILINSIKQRLQEIMDMALYVNIKFAVNVNRKYIKDIKEAEKLLKKYIFEMNNLYKVAMPDFALIGLKKTASDYYSFTGRELIDFLGIKQSSINKFRKINNISGTGYIYGKSEIEEILQQN